MATTTVGISTLVTAILSSIANQTSAISSAAFTSAVNSATAIATKN